MFPLFSVLPMTSRREEEKREEKEQRSSASIIHTLLVFVYVKRRKLHPACLVSPLLNGKFSLEESVNVKRNVGTHNYTYKNTGCCCPYSLSYMPTSDFNFKLRLLLKGPFVVCTQGLVNRVRYRL